MIVLFSAGASEIFAALPWPVKRRAARSIELLAFQPRMYPVRRRGIMRGYRYFVAHGFLFYYSVSSGGGPDCSNYSGWDAARVTSEFWRPDEVLHKSRRVWW